MANRILLALTNAVPGREDEFNRWYDDVHLGDVLKVPGIVSAQRFALTSIVDAPSPYAYLAIYEIEAERADAIIESLQSAGNSMVLSDAMSGEAGAWLARAITPVVQG